MEIIILVDNYASTLDSLRLKLLAEWGFAAYLKDRRVLYDTGSTGVALLNNMKALGISPDEPDWLVFSHRHDDHTGGLRRLLESRRRPLKIVAHEKLFEPAYAKDERGLWPIGFPMAKEELAKFPTELVLIRGPYKIADDVIASGEIPRRWGPTHNKAVYGPDPASEDLVADDVALYLATDDGLVALTGCGHAGVENIVEYGLELTGCRRVKAVVGGLHLLGLGEDRWRAIAEYLKRKRVERIIGAHCTGMLAAGYLAREVGALPSGVGLVVSI